MPSPQFEAIRRRQTRLTTQRTASGLLSVSDALALASVGFHAVSEVMGATARTLSYQAPAGTRTTGAQGGLGLFASGRQPEGWQGGADGSSPRTFVTSGGNTAAGRSPRIDALKAGYGDALARLVQEASAVGADGVLGISVIRSVSEFKTELETDVPVWNFLATGTAVATRTGQRAPTPFTAALSATETAAALHAGWVPVSYLACPVLAVRWVEPASRAQRRRQAGNGEIAAYTDAVNAARHQARTDLAEAAAAVHADGAVLSEMTLDVGPAIDLAEVTVVATGTALARFETDLRRPPTAVVTLSGARR